MNGSHSYDVVVVGARVAGASTAMLLARAGHRVLLMDRAKLPSDIAQGHFVYRDAPRRLHRWGLLDAITASGSPPLTTLTMDFGDFALQAHDLEVDGVPWGIGPRRGVLDKILLEAAISAGVDLQDEVIVDDVLTDAGAVTGIHARSVRTGTPLTIKARLTIGADGRHSSVAQKVRAPKYWAASPLTCWYFSYWSGAHVASIEMHVKNRRAMFVFPTNDGLTALFVAFPTAWFPQVRKDPLAHTLAALDLSGDLAQRMRAGRLAERVYGASDMHNFLRKPYGPGWALVGDAGSHKDPMLALGIAHALRDAELLAQAADAGLSNRTSLSDALAGYAAKRDAATLPDYQENLQLARLEPLPPDVFALRAALRDRPADARLFALANFGVIPRQIFFNPENLGRIMGDAAAAA